LTYFKFQLIMRMRLKSKESSKNIRFGKNTHPFFMTHFIHTPWLGHLWPSNGCLTETC